MNLAELCTYLRAVAFVHAARRLRLPTADALDAAQDAVEAFLTLDLHRVDWTKHPAQVRTFAARRARWAVSDWRRDQRRHADRCWSFEEVLEDQESDLDEERVNHRRPRPSKAGRLGRVRIQHHDPEVEHLQDAEEVARLTRAALHGLASLTEPERAAVAAGLEAGGLFRLAAARGVHPAQPTRWRKAGLEKLRAEIGAAA